MKAKKDFTEPQNLMAKKPAIYYVVKGRATRTNQNGEPTYFEQIFIDENPIIAREKAFSFYENYAQILEEHGILRSFAETEKFDVITPYFGGKTLQKFSTKKVVYTSNNQFDNGISLYMVIEKPFDKKEAKGQRYLIHGVWRFTAELFTLAQQGVEREYFYYTQHKYDMKNYVVEIEYSEHQKDTIIATPFSWINCPKPAQPQSKSIPFKVDKHRYSINHGKFSNNAFEPRLYKQKFIRIIASLLNRSGGNLYYGIDSNRKSKPVLNKVSLELFKAEMNVLIIKHFQKQSHLIKLNFIRVGGNVVAVFSIDRSKETVYVSENKQKQFYDRNDEGLIHVLTENKGKSIKIIDNEAYLKSRLNPNKKARLDDIIDFL